ncbi:Scarecrow-like protein 30 [Capsicum annuum]|nr:Scarecrow-like protein 30 [Capsicum annuum]KAF3628785.1 Scarecrow-like protein 30 [Capsicum annuum]
MESNNHSSLACDYFDGVLNYINNMLIMEEEEDLENRSCMLHDSLALQATEKSFYDALYVDQQLIQHTCVNYSEAPYGEATERMAHYFADALEARLAGTGIELYAAFAMRTITAADILKAFQVYVTALSNIFAGESIGMLTREATSIHIIDFGILYGFQWPCFIQGISLRPSGPPILRITGIDFPQPGFRPAERVEETGRQLAKYCRRFNVPFEYNAIAKKWDSIQLNDLKINKSEMLVVNCLYRLIYVPDETASENSPRDDVLRLIKQIKPDVFLHGIINGTHNSSFFETRFKEALFHYSSLFDMMEATVPRENQERLLFEKVNFGKEIMNIVAWEGTARVERPEPYKQWQLRN